MAIAARIIGSILLLLWLYYIRVARMHVQTHGQVMYATIFQFNILPFIVGISLLLFGNLWFLVMLPVAWVLSIRFPSFFLGCFPLAIGWAIGSMILSNIYPHSKGWYWGGGIIGIVAMVIVCSIVFAIITTPKEKRPFHPFQEAEW